MIHVVLSWLLPGRGRGGVTEALFGRGGAEGDVWLPAHVMMIMMGRVAEGGLTSIILPKVLRLGADLLEQ